MTDEEKKAIDKLKRSANYFVIPIYETKIILELIEKQSKEIEELFLNWYFENQKDNFVHKDKIKAEIEERNKWLQEYDEQEEMNELQKDDYRLIKVERNILQSLLEKE